MIQIQIQNAMLQLFIMHNPLLNGGRLHDLVPTRKRQRSSESKYSPASGTSRARVAVEPAVMGEACFNAVMRDIRPLSDYDLPDLNPDIDYSLPVEDPQIKRQRCL